ncbi:hypothetical protein [Dulcicalothrix desertica]|nr:hypothetical protein [Dulcicalothrix desertica]
MHLFINAQPSTHWHPFSYANVGSSANRQQKQQLSTNQPNNPTLTLGRRRITRLLEAARRRKTTLFLRAFQRALLRRN